jgi:hypothetical protein
VAYVSDSPASGDGVARATGEFVTSAARFSLAMGLFVARHATRFLSATPAQAAGSLDEVTNVASGPLAGMARTVFAVGANLQHGLVDATCDVAGLGPRGQAPSGSTAGLSVSLRTSVTRRLTGIRTVESGTLKRPVFQAELLQRLSTYHADALARIQQRDQVVASVWRSEGLATTVAKHLLPANVLNGEALPPYARPVMHVGFGSGSAEFVMFDVAKLNARFTDTCAGDYREFSYEGIGAILRAYERGFFRLMSGTLGLVRFDAPDGPSPAGFFAAYLKQFPPHIQRLIAHGYGRIVAFSHMDIYKAIREATTVPPGRVEPVVHGVAFAFAMINMADMPHILRHSAVPFEPAVRAAFQNGLIYGLVFLDWYTPGFLATWRPQGTVEAELIEHARREAALARERGFPLAFRLADPRR